MRPILTGVALVAVAAPFLAAQDPIQGDVYRGPRYISREATFVEPASGGPLEFSNSSLLLDYSFQTTVRSRSLRSIPASAITLRLAFGPTRQGMYTFRLRAVDRPPAPPLLITPARPPVSLQFRLVPEDPHPGVLALRPKSKIVFTVERISGEAGAALYENPDATELLWESLGRPSPTLP